MQFPVVPLGVPMRGVRIAILFAAVLLCALPASADTVTALPLTYLVSGVGGLSDPVINLSDSPFWWVNTTGNIPSQSLTDIYGFQPIQTLNGFVATFDPGSFLLSNSFYLSDGDTLKIAISMLGTGAYPYSDAGMILLLKDSVLSAVLLNARLDNVNVFGDFDPIPQLTSPSPGVNIVYTLPGLPGLINLGNVTYGVPPGFTSDCRPQPDMNFPCRGDFATSFAPGAGTYQLLFGEFGSNKSAMAIQNVSVQSVPEPSTLIMLAAGLTLLAFARRHS